MFQRYEKLVGARKAASRVDTLGIPLVMLGFAFIVMPRLFLDFFRIFFQAQTTGIELSLVITVVLLAPGSVLLAASLGHISLPKLGFAKGRIGLQIALGAVLGAVLAILNLGVAVGLGGLELNQVFVSDSFLTIWIDAIFFIAYGIFVVSIFVGALLPLFSRLWGDLVALVVNALLFAGVSVIFNPSFLVPSVIVDPVVYLNATLMGLVLSASFMLTGSLWVCGFGLAAYLWVASSIFGTPFASIPFLETVFASMPVVGADVVSGGAYGLQASLVTSGILAVLAVVLLAWRKRKGGFKSRIAYEASR